MKWNNPPSFEDVQKTFTDLGITRAKIRSLQETIKEGTREIKKNNPRKPWLLEESMPDEHRELAELEAHAFELEMQVKFYDFWKDLYKANGYINR